MKKLKISILLMLFVGILSCKKEVIHPKVTDGEVENLTRIQSISQDGYTVELFSKTGKLIVGYNPIFLRIKKGEEIQNNTLGTKVSWKPMMTMTMNGMEMSHSCPSSVIKMANGKTTLYEGNILFTMPSDAPTNRWKLTILVQTSNQKITFEKEITVLSSETDHNKVFTNIVGSDGISYMLALVEPFSPKIGTNDLIVALYKKSEDNNFPIVDHFKMKVDARMPGMGNHSAPGSVDLTQGEDGFYHGKVGFSMSGFWKINLQLENEIGTLLKGESVTENHPESSLNFKVEF